MAEVRTWCLKKPGGSLDLQTCRDSQKQSLDYATALYGGPWTKLYRRGFRIVEVTITEKDPQ